MILEFIKKEKYIIAFCILMLIGALIVPSNKQVEAFKEAPIIQQDTIKIDSSYLNN